MSITGSLVGYENNNDVIKSKKNRTLLNMSGSTSLKQCASLNSSISNSVITTASCSISNVKSKHQNSSNECKQSKKKRRFHLNSVWSIWYGILCTALHGYLTLQGLYRFLECSFIQWRNYPPVTELNIQIILCGIVLLVLPLFLISSVLKVGNLANDSVKLATGNKKCSAEPDDGLEEEAKGGTLKALWTHGGPTSAFLHITIALCLLLPRLLLEVRLIENGNLQRDYVWHTDLDFFLTHKDRFVVLSFMTSPYQNISSDIDNALDNSSPEFTDDDDDDDHGDSILYEKTDLIESFHSDFDDDGFFDTHEKLEIELPTTTIQPTLSQHIIYQTIVNGKQTTRTMNSNSENANNKKNERNRGSGGGGGGGNRHNMNSNSKNSGGSGSGNNSGGRKHIDKHDHSQSRNAPKDHTNIDNTDFTHRASNTNKKEKSRKSDDIDERLELRPSSKFDFDRGYEVSPVFEVAKNSRKNQKNEERRQGQRGDGNKKVIKDSEIHIVKKERPIDIAGPSTPLSTDSKIIEIKPENRSSILKRLKRVVSNKQGFVEEYSNLPRVSTNENNLNQQRPATPASLINAIVTNITAAPIIELTGIAKCLQSYLNFQRKPDMNHWSHRPSLEFLNLVLAITVWSARYPAVFWGTSKTFAIVFSIQLIANNIDIVLGYAGTSILYKLQITGQPLSMPSPPLLLNAVVTMSLFILSTILIIASSLILYLYGHGRLSAKIRDRRIISTKSDESWSYFAHCASLCFVLALAVVKVPIMHDLSACYRGSLDGAILASVLGSIFHIFLWIVLWLGLTAKRRWNFKLPPLSYATKTTTSVQQPLLISSSRILGSSERSTNSNGNAREKNAEDTIYWPKLTPNSPKLKVTFNDVPSTSSDHDLAEHDGKRNPGRRVSLCLSSPPGEGDDGDYATLRGPVGDLLHLNDLGNHCDLADDTSEEGKLLACVRDDSVTYASTRDLEPPNNTAAIEPFLESPQEMLSQMAPVTVTVHTNEAHVSSSTPRCLRRADSGVPTDALLTPRSDTTSTESSTSPPDRALSETSSGVHSGEEREEVVIRPRPAKAVVKPPQPVIQEEPFGRSTNMKMISFNNDGKSSATLPLTRGPTEPRPDYVNHCSTMPLPIGCHQPQFRSHQLTPAGSKSQLHTTLPNGVRYANSHFLRRLPHVKNAESPYGILGLGAGHHTFSKLLQDPLCHNIVNSTIHEDRDSANFSMISDHDREYYLNGGQQ